MFVYLFVCVYVCSRPISSGTAVSSILGQLRFKAKKIPDPGSGFSENPENPILAGNYRIFLQKYSNFHVENSRNNSANPVTYYLLRRKGRATLKSVEGAQPPPPDSGFSR